MPSLDLVSSSIINLWLWNHPRHRVCDWLRNETGKGKGVFCNINAKIDTFNVTFRILFVRENVEVLGEVYFSLCVKS